MKTNADKSTGSKLGTTLRAAEMIVKMARGKLRVAAVQVKQMRQKFKAAKKDFKQAKKNARQAKRELATAQAAFEETGAQAKKSQVARRTATAKANNKPAEVVRQKAAASKRSRSATGTRSVKVPRRPPVQILPDASSIGISPPAVPNPVDRPIAPPQVVPEGKGGG